MSPKWNEPHVTDWGSGDRASPKDEPLAKVESYSGKSCRKMIQTVVAGQVMGLGVEANRESMEAKCREINAATESWANARVRKALEEASDIAWKWGDGGFNGANVAASYMGAEIRKLKEKYK